MIKATTRFIEERAIKREQVFLRWARQQVPIGPGITGSINETPWLDFALLKHSSPRFRRSEAEVGGNR